MIVGGSGDSRTLWAFPMVCFCDIPLSQASEHMRSYGQYAIGMSKDWGIRSGIAPVLYTYDSSPLAKAVQSLVNLASGEDGQDITSTHESVKVAVRLGSFLKPYEGRLPRKLASGDRIRFYNEREWRFVPEEFLSTGEPTLGEAEFQDPWKLKAANDTLSKEITLRFEPSDIRYIIVSDQSEIVPLIKKIREVKAKYSEDEILLLASRILSADQVKHDL